MKYLKFIFENQDIKDLVLTNKNLIDTQLKSVIEANIIIEQYIYKNLEQFIAPTLEETYSNIRDFVVESNLEAFNESWLSSIADTAISGGKAALRWLTHRPVNPSKWINRQLAHKAIRNAGEAGFKKGMSRGVLTGIPAGGALGVGGAYVYDKYKEPINRAISSFKDNPQQPDSTDYLDKAKELVRKHPITSAGAAGLGLGTGAYYALKPKKSENE